MRVHFVRYTVGVVRSSLLILCAVSIVAAVLVYSPQGRAFLLIEGFAVTAYIALFGTIQIVLYARALADRVPAANADDGDQAADTRLRWLALWCGSRIVGLVAGLLLPCLYEDFVARNSGELATTIRTSMNASAALLVLLVAVTLLFELVWRIAYRRTENTLTRDLLMWLWTVAAIWLANHMNYLWPSRPFAFYLLFLIVGLVLSSLLVLPGNGPQQAVGGGVIRWLHRWTWSIAAGVWLVVGIGLAMRPDFAIGTGWVVWTVLQFWVALAVILAMVLKWGWHHQDWKPVVVAVALGMAMISFFGHALYARDLRKLDAAAITHPKLADAARQWLEVRRNEIERTKRYPVVLVATAGGGIRAAYWTAGVLAALQDAEWCVCAACICDQRCLGRKHRSSCIYRAGQGALLGVPGASGGDPGQGLSCADPQYDAHSRRAECDVSNGLAGSCGDAGRGIRGGLA